MFPTPRTRKLLGFGQLWSRGFHSCLQILIRVLTTKVTALVPTKKNCRPIRVNSYVPIGVYIHTLSLSIVGWSKTRFETGNEQLSVSRIDGCSQISFWITFATSVARKLLFWDLVRSANPPTRPRPRPPDMPQRAPLYTQTPYITHWVLYCAYTNFGGCLGRFGGVWSPRCGFGSI